MQYPQLSLPGVTATQRDQALTLRLNQSQKHKSKGFMQERKPKNRDKEYSTPSF